MARKTRFKYLTIALRPNGSAYGEDFISGGETPVTIQTSGSEIKPFEGEEIERELDDGNSGSSEVLLVGHRVSITAPVELAGSGTADVPVAYDPLIQICGRKRTINAGVNVEYSRIIDGSELDATIYFYMDGALHKCLGARAAMKINAKSKSIAKVTFEITAIYGGIVSSPFAKPDLSSFLTPVKVGKAHSSFSLDGTNYKLDEVNFNDNNTVSHEERIGHEEVEITEFAPDGDLTMEAPDIDTFDPFAIAKNHAKLPIEFVHGSDAGNTIKLSSQSIQLLRPEYADLNSLVGYKIGFRLIEDFTLTTQ